MANLVVDVSVFIDSLFEYDRDRTLRARSIFKAVDTEGHVILEPEIFGVELIAQLVRRKPRRVAETVYEKIMKRIILVGDLNYSKLFRIALKTGCRAIDAFYIAAAEASDAVLVTADKMMADNARKYGEIRSYYIHRESDFRDLLSLLGLRPFS